MDRLRCGCQSLVSLKCPVLLALVDDALEADDAEQATSDGRSGYCAKNDDLQ